MLWIVLIGMFALGVAGMREQLHAENEAAALSALRREQLL